MYFFKTTLIITSLLLLFSSCAKQPVDDLKRIDCLYQGHFNVPQISSSTPAYQVETDHGTFILDALNNTISIVTEIGISDIQLLEFKQPASQCQLLNPDFQSNQLVCTVSVEYPEFWDCAAGEETEFCYRFIGSCLPQEVGPNYD